MIKIIEQTPPKPFKKNTPHQETCRNWKRIKTNAPPDKKAKLKENEKAMETSYAKATIAAKTRAANQAMARAYDMRQHYLGESVIIKTWATSTQGFGKYHRCFYTLTQINGVITKKHARFETNMD